MTSAMLYHVQLNGGDPKSFVPLYKRRRSCLGYQVLDKEPEPLGISNRTYVP